MENILQLSTIASLPLIISVILYVIEKKTKIKKANNGIKQIVYGIIFGMLAVIATEYGVNINGATMNVRDASVLTAGLVFGAPAGIISGLIGGIERYYAIYWGAGTYTRIACTISTILAGFIGAFLRKFIFDNKKPSAFFALVVGILTEVLHMMMVFFTNMNDIAKAFTFVKQCTLPMVTINGIAVMLAVFIINCIGKEKTKHIHKVKQITSVFQRWLLMCVGIAFILTFGFVSSLQNGISKLPANEAIYSRDIAVYVTMFIETLVFAILFILIYFLIKRLVVDNIRKINNSLAKITSGNLDVVVNVRSNEEFASLSDDINSTVVTLKRYINEATTRIDKELELAREIQKSALPSIFPPYPERKDFDIFAMMNTAKEVGGDFYDFYFVDKDKLALIIADVSGKGIPAAMFMMTAKTTIKGYIESGKSVEDAMIAANNKLCENNDTGMFVTAWVGIVDLKTGLLEFVNAGHNFPLLKHKNSKFEFVKSKVNLVLAGMSNVKYTKNEIQLEEGDMIYLYTDGVTEAMNTRNYLYGNDRLKGTLDSSYCFNAQEICNHVKKDVDRFSNGADQFDDITMLCLKFQGVKNNEIKVGISLNELNKITQFVENIMLNDGVSRSVSNKMNIAIDEIYSNIVKFSGATYAKISCYADRGVAYLRFEDDGVPYNPLNQEDVDITLSAEERPIGSLGIFMVKKSMDDMKYEYTNSKNILTLSKKM